MVNKNKFDDWLRLKGLSESTIYDYGKYVKKIEFDKLSNEYLLKWLSRYNNPMARATLKNVLYYIRTQCPKSPKSIHRLSIEFEIPKITGRKKKKAITVISKQDVHRLALGMKTPRDRLMILTTFYCGLRSNELTKIRLKSFNWDEETVKVIGKGNKERIVPVHPILLRKIAKYVNSSLDKDPNFDRVFGVSNKYWRYIVRHQSIKVLGRYVNPHLLRHSCGSYLYKKGLDIKIIADFLGHASISTTQIYVHLDPENRNRRVLEALG